jgi:hypothetical protein
MTPLRDLMLADLEGGLAIVRDGHEESVRRARAFARPPPLI